MTFVLFLDGEGIIKKGYTSSDFISMYIPAFRSKSVHRQQAIHIIHSTGFSGLLHIPTTIDKWKSVEYHVIVIQCAMRRKLAYYIFLKKRRLHLALVRFQRMCRRKNKYITRAISKIQFIYRIYKSKRILRRLKLEHKSIIKIQCAYRLHRAKMRVMNIRSVETMVVLKCSSFVLNHEPEKCLEHRPHTFWMADSHDMAGRTAVLIVIDMIMIIVYLLQRFEWNYLRKNA